MSGGLKSCLGVDLPVVPVTVRFQVFVTLNPPDGSIDESQVLAKPFDSKSKLAASVDTSRHTSHCKLNTGVAFLVDPAPLSAMVRGSSLLHPVYTDSSTRPLCSTRGTFWTIRSWTRRH